MDLGLLLVRVVIGAVMFAHGMQKLTGAFGGHGLKGTAGFMGSLGYRSPERMALAAGFGEATAGALLFLGFLTPLGAAALIGVMVNAIFAVHAPNGPWNTQGGYEYTLVLATIGAGLAFIGPGELSVDGALDLGMAGALWGFAAIALGCLSGAVVLWSRHPAQEEVSATEDQRAA